MRQWGHSYRSLLPCFGRHVNQFNSILWVNEKKKRNKGTILVHYIATANLAASGGGDGKGSKSGNKGRN